MILDLIKKGALRLASEGYNPKDLLRRITNSQHINISQTFNHNFSISEIASQIKKQFSEDLKLENDRTN